MPQILTELKRQHANFARLLGVLRYELDVLSRSGTPDYALMRDVMLYMTRFPDRLHHPKEELVFQRVLAIEPSVERSVHSLSREHEQILGKGRQLLQYLEFVANDYVLPRDLVESSAWEYVAAMYQHMRTEENGLFRVAERTLSSADWTMIDRAVRCAHDPVFGRVVGEEFTRLYDAAMHRSDWKHAATYSQAEDSTRSRGKT